jgi:iron(III) transport system permease protein
MKIKSMNWILGGVTLLLLLPFIFLFSGLTEGSLAVFYRTLISEVSLNTFSLIFLTCFFSFLWAIPTAYLQSQFKFKGYRWLEWALVLPLSFPSYILAYTYKGMLGPFGTLHSFTNLYLEIDTIFYLSILFSLALYPYLYLILKAVLRYQNTRLIEASMSLGYSYFTSLRKVTLPLLVPSVFAGSSIIAMEILNNFGAVSYFGISTFTTEIIKKWSPVDATHSIGISLALVLVVAIIFGLDYYYKKNRNFDEGLDNYQNDIPYATGNTFRFGVFIQILPFLLGFFLPLLQLGYWSFQEYEMLFDSEFITLFIRTISLAFQAVIVCLLIALLFVGVNRFLPSKTSRFLQKISTVGYALPGVVVAIAVLQFAGFINDISGVYILNYLPVILLFSYVVRFQTLSVNTLASASEKIPVSYHHGSRVLGYSFWKTLLKIDLPLFKPAIVSAMLLVFVDITKELPLTMLFQTFNMETLAVRSYLLMITDGAVTQSAIPSLFIVLIGIIPVRLMVKMLQKN